MKYQYVVILRRSGEGAVNLMSLLLCGGSALLFALFGITGILRYLSYVISALIFAGLIFNAVAARRHTKPVTYKFLLLLSGLGWLMIPYLEWVGLIFGVLAFLEHQTKRPLEIGFNRDQVVINTLFRRRLGWSDLNNVILRDGLLTIDFKNNRLIQREIADDEDEDDADEEEFNAFCRDQLNAAGNQSQGEAYGK